MSLLLLLSLAQASETCADSFAESASYTLGSEALRLDRGVLTLGGLVLAKEVLELDVQGERAVFVMRNGPRRDLVVWDGALRTLVQSESPAQVRLSDDGEQVAYVNGVTSITAVYVVPFVGGEPRQLTNVDLVRNPGKAPVGFVESPSQGLVFDGADLVWEGSSTTHRVRWTGGDR